MAGEEGFEPPHDGSRARCLTTWLLPKTCVPYHALMNVSMSPFTQEDTRRNILDAALRLLEEDGFAMEHAEAREILSGAGAEVGNDGRVRLPHALIERALATADLIAFAELSDALPLCAAQSTALVPGDVPPEIADSYRLAVALLYGGHRAGGISLPAAHAPVVPRGSPAPA